MFRLLTIVFGMIIYKNGDAQEGRYIAPPNANCPDVACETIYLEKTSIGFSIATDSSLTCDIFRHEQGTFQCFRADTCRHPGCFEITKFVGILRMLPKPAEIIGVQEFLWWHEGELEPRRHVVASRFIREGPQDESPTAPIPETPR